MTKRRRAAQEPGRLPSALQGIYTKLRHRKDKQPPDSQGKVESKAFQVAHGQPDRSHPGRASQMPSDAERLGLIQTTRERLVDAPQRLKRQSHDSSTAIGPSWSRENAMYQGGTAAQLSRTPGAPRPGTPWVGREGGRGETRPPPALYTSGPRVFFEQDARTAKFENPRTAPVPVPAPIRRKQVAKPSERSGGRHKAREVKAPATRTTSRGISGTSVHAADQRVETGATLPSIRAGQELDKSPARGGGKTFRRGKDPPFPSRPRNLPSPPGPASPPSPSATAAGEAPRTPEPLPRERPSALKVPVHASNFSLTTSSTRLDGTFASTPYPSARDGQRAAPPGNDAAFAEPARENCRLCRGPGAGGPGGLCTACETGFLAPKDAFGEPDDPGAGRVGETRRQRRVDPYRAAGGAAPETAGEPEDEVEMGAGRSFRFEGPLSPLWAEPTQRAAQRVRVWEVERDEVLVSTLRGAGRREARGARSSSDGDTGRPSPRVLQYYTEEQRPPEHPSTGATKSTPGSESDSSATVVVSRPRGRQGDEKAGSATRRDLPGGGRKGRVDSCFDDAATEEGTPTVKPRQSWSSSVYSAKTSDYYDEILDLIDLYKNPDEGQGQEIPHTSGHKVKAPKAPPRPAPSARPSRGMGIGAWI